MHLLVVGTKTDPLCPWATVNSSGEKCPSSLWCGFGLYRWKWKQDMVLGWPMATKMERSRTSSWLVQDDRMISKSTVKTWTIAQELNCTWVTYIKGALTVQVLVEYLHIWNLVDGMVLQPDAHNHHWRKLTKYGSYTSKLSHAAFFIGNCQVWSLEKNLEELGDSKIQILLLLAINTSIGWMIALQSNESPIASPACLPISWSP